MRTHLKSINGRGLVPGLFTLLFLAATSPAQEAGGGLLKGPYLQGPGTNTMTVKWEASVNTPAVLHYGLAGAAGIDLPVTDPRPLKAVTTHPAAAAAYLYEAVLTNLQPASVYSYSVQVGTTRTAARQFHTFASQQPKVTFIGYGDARTNPKTHRAVVTNFKRYAPDFILHTGDLVVDGRKYDLWGREFFEPLADVIDEVPVLPSLGNHEQDGNLYLFYLGLPGKQRYYSYDIGPVHVVALDFRQEKLTDEQYAFARADLLASKAPWKVVFTHYPVYNIGGHATGWGHESYLPLFLEAKVDLAVVGHSHVYERFRPVTGTNVQAPWAITHLTTGGGGAPLYPAWPHPALATYSSTNHFVVFEATATTLKGRTYNTNNVLLDEFELTKDAAGRQPAAYLAQAYPEEPLKFFWQAATNLTAAVAGIPGTATGTPARFTLRSVPPLAAARPWEISLAPESLPYYEFVGDPVQVTVPGPGQPEQVVWAQVRSRGVKPITIDPRNADLLTPALVFQARTHYGPVEALSYGHGSRISKTAAEAAAKLEGK